MSLLAGLKEVGGAKVLSSDRFWFRLRCADCRNEFRLSDCAVRHAIGEGRAVKCPSCRPKRSAKVKKPAPESYLGRLDGGEKGRRTS